MRATAGPWLLSVLALCGLAVAAVGVVHAHEDGQVRRTGTRADATILARSYSARAPDRLRLAFATGSGDVVDTRVAVGDAHSFPAGIPVPLRYDPARPSHVVLLHGQESRLVRPLVFGGLVAVTAVGCLLLVRSRQRQGVPVALRGSRGRAAAGVAAVAVLVVLVSGIVPTPVLGAAPTCPSPPETTTTAGPLGADALGAALVADGLTPSVGEPLTAQGMASVVYAGDPTAAAELVAAGFTAGWYVPQQLDGHQVQAFAVELRDPTAARRYEAQRLVRVCQGAHRSTYPVAVTASDGTFTDSGVGQNRIAILRASRVYYLVEHGDPRKAPPALVTAARRLAAAAE